MLILFDSEFKISFAIESKMWFEEMCCMQQAFTDTILLCYAMAIRFDVVGYSRFWALRNNFDLHFWLLTYIFDIFDWFWFLRWRSWTSTMHGRRAWWGTGGKFSNPRNWRNNFCCKWKYEKSKLWVFMRLPLNWKKDTI